MEASRRTFFGVKYLRISLEIQLRSLQADQLEEFVNDWLGQRYKDYHSHQLWRGTGDLGRDVTGYVTKDRMEGPWDNYQCKQLGKSLSETSAFVELGKIFMHSASGAYSLPRRYIFVAPRGVVRNVQELVAHPERFRQAFLDRWDSDISHRLVAGKNVPLSSEIIAKIEAFDFTEVDCMDSVRLINDKDAGPAKVKWFNHDPGPSPRGIVPDQIEDAESVYIGQLLQLYCERGPDVYANVTAALESVEFGPHLKDQRTRFFDAVAFDRFYRDSTPKAYLTDLREEIYHGVSETHRELHKDGLTRVSEVMKQAASLPLSGVLGRYAGSSVKQGTCHRFANEGRLPWKK